MVDALFTPMGRLSNYRNPTPGMTNYRNGSQRTATDHNGLLDTVGGSTPKFPLKCTIIFCCILGGEEAQTV